jgi:hypothetical protein
VILPIVRWALLATLCTPLFAGAYQGDEGATHCQAFARVVLKAVHAAPKGELRAIACTAIANKASTLVAVAYAREGYRREENPLPVYVAVVDDKTGTVSASGQIDLTEDGSQEMSSGSLEWDGKPLDLAPQLSGYALHIDASVFSGSMDGGRGASLTVFMTQGRRMRPVLGDVALRTFRCLTLECREGTPDYEESTTTYAVADSRSHGLRDIVLTTRSTRRTEPGQDVARFDGTKYAIEYRMASTLSHCRPFEMQLLNCRIKNSGNVVSVCGQYSAGSASHGAINIGQIQYRSGPPDHVELEYPAAAGSSADKFHFYSTVAPDMSKTAEELWFMQGRYLYDLAFTETIIAGQRTEATSEVRVSDRMTMERIAAFPCEDEDDFHETLFRMGEVVSILNSEQFRGQIAPSDWRHLGDLGKPRGDD